MKVHVEITRKDGLADPEGSTVARALLDLGFTEVLSARFGKVVTLEIDGDDPEAARSRVEDMCRQLLANPVMEDFAVTVVDDPDSASQP